MAIFKLLHNVKLILLLIMTFIIVVPLSAKNIYRANLHIHTNISQSPEDNWTARWPIDTIIKNKVIKNNSVDLDVIGLSDHYLRISDQDWPYLLWLSDETQRVPNERSNPNDENTKFSHGTLEKRIMAP